MLYRRGVLIYNPAAGRRRERRRRQVEQACEVLRAHLERLEPWPTEGPGTATGLAQRAVETGADLVLACGGDGTINEVLNGLAGSEATMGVLPAGTANVLAVEVGLPLDPVESARLLPWLQPCRISLGRVCCAGAPLGGRYFLLMAGFGVDAHIVYTLNPALKSRLGILAYFLAGFREIARCKPVFQVECEGRRFDCTFALASKSAEYGGRLRIAGDACLLEEAFQVVLFHTQSRHRYLISLGAVLTGSLPRLRDVTFLKENSLRLTAQEALPVQVDGEYIGRLPATVEIVPQALTLLLPPSYQRPHG